MRVAGGGVLPPLFLNHHYSSLARDKLGRWLLRHMMTAAEGSHCEVKTGVDEAASSRVIIEHPERFLAKKAKFLCDGAAKLQVVTDFDFTLTQFWWEPDVRASSCHKVIEDCGLLPPAYHDTAQRLQSHYYPLEVDPSISLEQKFVHMEEWVTKAHDALIEYGFRKRMLEQAVSEAKLKLRDGVHDLFQATGKNKVPLLVFSAGLANVMEEVFKQNGVDTGSAHIVSNSMVFDDSEKLVGFTSPVFHVLNKRASSVATAPFFQLEGLDRRRCVLLLGDNPGDLHMSDGISYDTIISVGFLNDRVEERLKEYAEKFDVVVVGDGDLTYVNELLKEIVGSET